MTRPGAYRYAMSPLRAVRAGVIVAIATVVAACGGPSPSGSALASASADRSGSPSVGPSAASSDPSPTVPGLASGGSIALARRRRHARDRGRVRRTVRGRGSNGRSSRDPDVVPRRHAGRRDTGERDRGFDRGVRRRQRSDHRGRPGRDPAQHDDRSVLPVLVAGRPKRVVPRERGRCLVHADRAGGRQRTARWQRTGRPGADRQPVLLRLDRPGPAAGPYRPRHRRVPRGDRTRWRACRPGARGHRRLPVGRREPRLGVGRVRSSRRQRRGRDRPRCARRLERARDAGLRGVGHGVRPDRQHDRRYRSDRSRWRCRRLPAGTRPADRPDQRRHPHAGRRAGGRLLVVPRRQRRSLHSVSSRSRSRARRSCQGRLRRTLQRPRCTWSSSTSPAATSGPIR